MEDALEVYNQFLKTLLRYELAKAQDVSPNSTYNLLQQKQTEINVLNREITRLSRENKAMREYLLSLEVEREAYAQQQAYFTRLKVTTRNQLDKQAEICKRLGRENFDLRYEIGALQRDAKCRTAKLNAECDSNELRQKRAQIKVLEEKLKAANKLTSCQQQLLTAKNADRREESAYANAGAELQKRIYKNYHDADDIQSIKRQFNQFKESCINTLVLQNRRIADFERMFEQRIGQPQPTAAGQLQGCSTLKCALQTMEGLVEAAKGK